MTASRQPRIVGDKLIWLPPGDPNDRAALRDAPRGGELLLIGHGDRERQTLAGLDAAAIAEQVRAHPGWQPGRPLRVDACWLGCRDDGFGQQLADALGSPVLAPVARTLSFIRWSTGPWHSVAIGRSKALPLWPARWRRFEPRRG